MDGSRNCKSVRYFDSKFLRNGSGPLIPGSIFSDFGFIPDLGKTNFRTFEVPRGSTKQHDIYSFGIIVQEGIRGPNKQKIPLERSLDSCCRRHFIDRVHFSWDMMNQ